MLSPHSPAGLDERSVPGCFPSGAGRAVPRESPRYLLGRAAIVADRIRALIAHRRGHDPAPDDPFRGLYLSDEVVDQLLLEPAPAPRTQEPSRTPLEADADRAEAAGVPVRPRRLARAAGLTDDDLELLIICLLPDLDSKFEKLYGYLNDDVTRRRATIGLALTLAGLSPTAADARARLSPGAPLVDNALILVEETDRPFLTRGLRVPDRVTAHLLGDDRPAAELIGLLREPHGLDSAQAGEITRALAEGHPHFYVRESFGSAGTALGVAGLHGAHKVALSVDATRVATRPDPCDVVRVLGREALLRDGGLVLSPVEALAERAPDALVGLGTLPVPVILTGTSTWDPRWSGMMPVHIDAQRLTLAERTGLWARELPGSNVDVRDIAAQFVLAPDQVHRAVRSAQASSRLTNGTLSRDQLRRGARAQNAAGLERLARRIEPRVRWDDIVLPERVHAQLRELAARARHRDLVLSEWNMRPGGGRGQGVTALFAGDSGTGKTMAAEVIAGDLGLDLYTVNLAAVVDKYIGETEKNLERIFTEAGGVNAVLLFDEADAIFGKRSDVRDAHDRYANIESAYLLQRMETFDGLAVLATNLRANLDEAFTRRLDMVVDFPVPDEDAMRALWERCLASPLPCRDDIDIALLSRSFKLSGGNIRSAAITAAYLGAASSGEVEMRHVSAAVAQEYRKLGRLAP
jgi:ATPase family protein associated with various cellular activities (AAA)/winged helix domain-containing protein